MAFIATFIHFPAVQIENRLRFDKVRHSLKVGRFFETQYFVFPICVPLQLCLSSTVDQTLSLVKECHSISIIDSVLVFLRPTPTTQCFPTFKEVTRHNQTSLFRLYIRRALLLLCINQQTKFEVRSFTDSKDMMGAKFKKPRHVTLTTPIRVIESHALDIFYLHTKFGDCCFASVIPEVGLQVSKLKNGSRDL